MVDASPALTIETHECQCEVHRCKVIIPVAARFCETCASFHETPGESRRSTHSLIRDGAEQALAAPIETLKRLQQRIAHGDIAHGLTLDERDIAVGQLSGVIAYLRDRR
jgi:hypothetical protein